MRILYVAMKYDYGKPEQGLSYEHCNFFTCLQQMGHEILYFDFMSLHDSLGKEKMNARLREIVVSEKPDLMFTFLFFHEFDPAVIEWISRHTDTITLNWFADDHWRFDNFTCHWAPHFNWSVTTSEGALPKYARIGYDHVIKSQWACNPFVYKKLDVPLKYDVTFVGKLHWNRGEFIDKLRRSGIDVRTWGRGWENERVTQDEMIRIFNQSRINLNLMAPGFVPLAPLPVRAAARALRGGISRVVKSRAMRERLLNRVDSAVRASVRTPDQIKGRNFEVPGCGGFLLTGTAENLDSYYEPGREVATYRSTNDLVRQVRYYLSHETERAAAAEAGYRRTLAEHTFAHRFTDIFEKIGLETPPLVEVLEGRTALAEAVDVS